MLDNIVHYYYILFYRTILKQKHSLYIHTVPKIIWISACKTKPATDEADSMLFIYLDFCTRHIHCCIHSIQDRYSFLLTFRLFLGQFTCTYLWSVSCKDFFNLYLSADISIYKQIYILILNLSLIYNLIVPTYIISIIIVCDIFVLYTILPIFERMYINQHLSIFSYSKCGNISVVIGAVSIPQIYSQLLYSSSLTVARQRILSS